MNVRFGSLAVVQDKFSRMSALGCKAVIPGAGIARRQVCEINVSFWENGFCPAYTPYSVLNY
jgi:hypothetical protein